MTLVPTGETRTGFRVFHNRILTGTERQFLYKEVLATTGEEVVKETWVLKPTHQFVRNRSKYLPHQGAKECARRMK